MDITDLDRTDLRILDALQQDASMSAAQVAERVGVTAPTAWRRINRLEKGGVIIGRHAALDPKKVGIGLTVYVRVRLVSGGRECLVKFANAMQSIPEVVDCVAITGDANFLLRVVVKDAEAYEGFFVDALSNVPGLLSTESAIVLSTIKSSVTLPLGTEQRRGKLGRA